MNRDELLTKLAMEMGEWITPSTDNLPKLYEAFGITGIKWSRESGTIIEHRGENIAISERDWLHRRAELINKPSWSEAPEWAKWLAQGMRGEWCFYPEKPEQSYDMWINDEPKTGIWVDVHCTGKIPKGHDWRETPERRPASEWPEDRMDVIGSNGNEGSHYMTEKEEEMPANGSWHNPGSLAEDLARVQAKHRSDTTPAESILAAARQHMLDRASTYDKPDGERSMGATVDAFMAVTGIDMTEEQGWLFMQLLKAVRSQQGNYRADSYEDGAAYVALAGEAAARDRKN